MVYLRLLVSVLICLSFLAYVDQELSRSNDRDRCGDAVCALTRFQDDDEIFVFQHTPKNGGTVLSMSLEQRAPHFAHRRRRRRQICRQSRAHNYVYALDRHLDNCSIVYGHFFTTPARRVRRQIVNENNRTLALGVMIRWPLSYAQALHRLVDKTNSPLSAAKARLMSANPQTQAITRWFPVSPRNEHGESAARRLAANDVAFIGSVSHYDKSMCLLSAYLNEALPYTVYSRHHVNESLPHEDDEMSLSADVERIVRDRSALDFELFNRANSIVTCRFACLMSSARRKHHLVTHFPWCRRALDQRANHDNPVRFR